MFVQCISSGSYSIYVGRDELTARHLSADTVTCSDAVTLCRDAIGPLPEETCLELYPGRDGVLIFARRAETPSWYAFDSLDDLTAAAASCRNDADACLYHCDGVYILGVRDGAHRLSEFGRPLFRPASFRLYLEEHGRCLAECGAVELLKEIG